MSGCPSSRIPREGLGLGVALTVAAAVSWAAYGLAQKKLHENFSSQQVLWIIYVGAVVLMLPVSAPATIFELDGLQLGMLAFCCVNTLAAYGSFGEALYHWDMSRVSRSDCHGAAVHDRRDVGRGALRSRARAGRRTERPLDRRRAAGGRGLDDLRARAEKLKGVN